MTETFNLIIPGLKTTLGYSTTSGGSATGITQVKSIDGPTPEMGMIDSSGLLSTWGEQVATGLPKGGDLTCTVWYNPSDSTHTALFGYFAAGTLLYYTLTFPSPVGPGATAPGSPKTYTFAGYLTSYPLSGFEDENGVELALKIGITGAITPV